MNITRMNQCRLVRLRGLCVFVAGITTASSPVSANMIAGWNFNDLALGGSVFEASAGTGTFSLQGNQGGWTPYEGTLLNGVAGWESGEAIGIRSALNNGMEMFIDIDEYILGSMTLSLAAKRSSTGFSHLLVEVYQPKGWIEVVSRGLGLDWGLIEASVLLEEFDYPVSRLRLTINGATSSQGTARFDNIRLEGNVIPSPGGVFALLPSWCVVRRQRRRHA